ncbi:HAD-IIIA family hydrolase [Patescibacteria group bacterium]|nr:HAD-IIIA family hydrolase [Patescibacteria group bacterium]
MNIKKRAVFLDRDGVINDTVDRGEDFCVFGKKVRWTAPFNYSEFKIKDGVTDALKDIRAAGWLLILVTNQPDVTYGFLSTEEHERIMADTKALPFDDIYVCKHGRNDNCDCKKPKPGMLLSAAEKWDIDLSASVMVGDTESDMGAAKAAGCSFILIDDQYNKNLSVNIRAKSLMEAAEKIKEPLINIVP